MLARIKTLWGSTPLVLCYAGLVLLCWAPVIVLYFPGNVAPDGYWQLNFYWLGDVSPGDIHPPFSTYVLGALYFLGEALAGANAGIACVVVVQLALALTAYGLVFSYVASTALGKRGALAVALFYGLVPLFANTGMTVFKDSLYLSLFVLFVLTLVKLYNRIEQVSTQRRLAAATQTAPAAPTTLADLAALVGLGLLLCLFRKEAVYIVGATLFLCGLVRLKARWKESVGSLVAFALGISLLGAAGLTSSGFKSGGISLEMMSIPLQQVARTVRDAPEGISIEEMAVIEQVFVYNASTPIAEKYDPALSDPVKGFNTTIAPETMARFAQVYVALGMRHPRLYLEAFIDQTSGYYTPWQDSSAWYGQQSAEAGADTGNYELASNYLLPSEVREGFESTWLALWRLPLPLGLLWSGGVYIWLTLACGVVLLRARRSKALVALVPTLLVFVFCLLSPVNGNQRYLMPVIATAPLLLAFAGSSFATIRGNDRAKTSEKRPRAHNVERVTGKQKAEGNPCEHNDKRATS